MELNDYINIFSEEFAGELPPNYPGDHAIKINNKDPLYGPLYNLSIRELEVLNQYLNKILERKWTIPFTNLAKAPILFILKKDKSLRLYNNNNNNNLLNGPARLRRLCGGYLSI